MNLLLGLIHSLHYAAHIVVNGIDSRIHISQYMVKHLHSITLSIFFQPFFTIAMELEL